MVIGRTGRERAARRAARNERSARVKELHRQPEAVGDGARVLDVDGRVDDGARGRLRATFFQGVAGGGHVTHVCDVFGHVFEPLQLAHLLVWW
jgi:hypothetical protein